MYRKVHVLKQQVMFALELPRKVHVLKGFTLIIKRRITALFCYFKIPLNFGTGHEKSSTICHRVIGVFLESITHSLLWGKHAGTGTF